MEGEFFMYHRIKNIIFYFSISYMFLFSIFTFLTLINAKEEIEITSGDYYSSTIKSLKTEINKLNNSKCKDSINNLLNISENTIFQGTVNVKKLYNTVNNNGSMVNGYIKVKNNCNIDPEIENKLSPYILNSSLTYENLIQKYMFQYEISIKDNDMRFIAESMTINNQLRTTKLQELDVIKKIVEVQNEK